jgi:serine phosphatase RsbU (regulator of sigma subunit)
MVVGDVSGHGLQSAVVMGRIRSALRAYALVSDDPAEVLTLLDRKAVHFEAGSLTTTLYVTISPDATTMRASLAGHPRPVLAVPGRPNTLLPLAIDPPLGIGPRGVRRRTTTADLPPGAVLVSYTDGLVERRGRLFDVGVARLMEAVPVAPVETVCDTVMTALGTEQPADDIALLAVRRLPDEEPRRQERTTPCPTYPRTSTPPARSPNASPTCSPG